jgi:hypothetical protein
MMLQHMTVSNMLNQSTLLLKKPSVQSLKQFELCGGQGEALIYVGGVSTLAGIICFVFGHWFGGIGDYVYGLLGGVLFPLIGFVVSSLTIFYTGRRQGGMGTLDAVFYTCSLLAPLPAIGMIAFFTASALDIGVSLFLLLALVALVVAIYQTYLTYLATRSSMNLDKTKVIITMIVAVVATIVVEVILDLVLAVVATNIATFIFNASWRGY